MKANITFLSKLCVMFVGISLFLLQPAAIYSTSESFYDYQGYVRVPGESYQTAKNIFGNLVKVFTMAKDISGAPVKVIMTVKDIFGNLAKVFTMAKDI